jgi:sortase B
MKRIKNKHKSLALLFLITVFTLGFGFFGYQTYLNISPTFTSERYFDKIRTSVKEELSNGELAASGVDFERLEMYSGDVKGWITNPGTSIDYPIVQSKDNQFYLNHLPDGSYNENGSIFLDYENAGDFTDEVSTIYGHHISLDRVFSPLSHYKKQSYYEEHKKMYLYTNDKVYEIELFAGNIIRGDEKFPRFFEDDQDRQLFLENAVNNSTFQSKVKMEKGDKIFILCTCSYEFEDARYAVLGRLSEIKVNR